jgi:transcription-repair coupling factor (superfamily II helicase)
MKNRRLYKGCERAALPALVASLRSEFPRQLVVVERNADIAELAEDLREWTGSENIFELPCWDCLPFEPVAPSADISAKRLEAARALLGSSTAIVVSSPEGLMQKIAGRQHAFVQLLELRPHTEISRSHFIEHLIDCGFRRSTLVEDVGDFAVRGAVIDFYPASRNQPVRAEWDADTLAELRLFDTQSQRSQETIASQMVASVREWIPASRAAADWRERLRRQAEHLQVPLREGNRLLSAFEHDEHFPEQELLAYLIADSTPVISPDVSREWAFITEDSAALIERAGEHEAYVRERFARNIEQSEDIIPNREDVYLSQKEFEETIEAFSMHIECGAVHIVGDSSEEELRNFPSHSLREVTERLKGAPEGGKISPLASCIHRYREDGYAIALVIGSPARAKRLAEKLLEFNLLVAQEPDLHIFQWRARRKPALVLLSGNVSRGAVFPDEHMVVISESDIFSERSTRGKRRRTPSMKKLLNSLAQLKVGDYLVHVDYGIGIYRGLRQFKSDGVASDLLEIEYADSVLCVPVHNIAHVQKFSGPEGQEPRIDKLRSLRWTQTKAKIRKSLETLAGELIRLYAARSVAKGWRFEPMNSEDEKFAEDFAYDETADQWRAIEETLGDMASDKPMDRLICGDVGFGKTEVALRAAYKCFQHQRQVAVLAPTTILAEQHYETFRKRLMDSPAQVGIVSRFHSPQQNKNTLAALAAGKIDIIVGTHRLLSRDVGFYDLGLLIIDEEHRFGVKQKERLKQFKKQVDVLTLTATPIPRTLHMSLLDIRDISLIRTPPVDRRSVRTFVASVDHQLIRDALLRELHRGGQSYVVHNRVQGIEIYCAQLQELVPEARFAFAHGQMSEGQLEKIMHRFLTKEIDVLVCTTIIESGIDIPTANTILIDRADRFGLAQLYQLRGRVGRSSLQAFCYFLVPKRAKMTAEAARRLHALESLDELGHGFELALRDLEIRGTGNLLGKEQSGSVLAIGFELYTRILKEAVANLRDEDLALDEIVEPELKVDIDASIPDWYIPDVSEKLVLYQRLASVGHADEVQSLRDEIRDRFGPLPSETERYLELMVFRCELVRIGAVKADVRKEKTQISFHRQARVDAARILELVAQESDLFSFGRNLTLTIFYPSELWEKGPGFVFQYILRQLQRCASAPARPPPEASLSYPKEDPAAR